MPPRITLITCVSSNNGIGYLGQLLFRIKEDLENFKRTTLGHYVVMGRKTAESLPKGEPLPGRFNIVLTRDGGSAVRWEQKGFISLHTVEDVIAHTKEEDEIFIIGGAEIYNLFMPHARRILLTRVGATPPADSFFPNLPTGEWQLRQGKLHPPGEGTPSYIFQEWMPVRC